MKRFVERVDHNQSTLFAERLEDFIAAYNPVRQKYLGAQITTFDDR